MSISEKAVDSPEVDNTNRKTFTDLRAESIDVAYGRAMTQFYNGFPNEAVAFLIDAAIGAADDRRIVHGLNALLTVLDEDHSCYEKDVVALQELAATAEQRHAENAS